MKLICLQSDGVLALMDADVEIQDKEFSRNSVLGDDNKTLFVTVTANSETQ